jgi:ribosomal protein S18 acetylase RimI-like enzyme
VNPEVAIVVREARPDDLTAVAAVFLACWHDSYAGFLPPDVIGMYDEDGARALWRPTLTDPPADAVVLVAAQTGRGVLGVVRVGKDPDEPTAGHVYSLYVHPAAQGLGVGTRLLAAADDRFRRDGMDEVTLWVFAANAAARGFYARLGWQPDGAERVEPQYGEPELRLRRTLRDHNGDGGAV